MKLGLYEAAHEDVAIALLSENFKLDGMDQAVEQGALGHFLVEHHQIEKRQGVHVRDLGQVHESEGPIFLIKRWIGNASSLEFDDAHAIEQRSRKIRPHQ